MSLFGWFGPAKPSGLAELRQLVKVLETQGDTTQAARVAKAFAMAAADQRDLDELARLRAIAVAMLLVARCILPQIRKKKVPEHKSLVAFFYAYVYSFHCFQQVLGFGRESPDWNTNDEVYPDFVELNELYDQIYRWYPEDLLSAADVEANEKFAMSR